MRENLKGVIWRLTAFLTVCAFGVFALLAVFGEFRLSRGTTYNAEFSNVTGLRTGDLVRIAGVEVGKVKNIAIERDATVRVAFTTDDSVVLTEGTEAAIRYDDLFGGRYLALEEGTAEVGKLGAGQTIPQARTKSALDLDALLGGFRPLFRALNPDQMNELTGQLVEAFQGQGGAIRSFLDRAAVVTNTLANQDQLVGQVIDNLNVVLSSLGGQADRFDKAVVSLSGLMHGLAERKTDISNAVAYTSAAAGSVAELLSQAREPFHKVVHETDRTSSIAIADRDYLDDLLNTLPDSYQMLGRQAVNGAYFSFYLCSVALKVNGKGGQPVYIKLIGQDTGRCEPK